MCWVIPPADRKSTRLNSSHRNISYAVFCLKKKNPAPEPCPPRDAPMSDREVGVGAPRMRLCSGWAGVSTYASAERLSAVSSSFFFNDTAPTEIYTLSLHAALPISLCPDFGGRRRASAVHLLPSGHLAAARSEEHTSELQSPEYLGCRLLLEKKKVSSTLPQRSSLGNRLGLDVVCSLAR